MHPISQAISTLDWTGISTHLEQDAYALLPKFFSPSTCQDFISDYNHRSNYRKTVNMQRHGFGLGEYKYFNYPLPDKLQALRAALYSPLQGIANQWMQELKLEQCYPPLYQDFLQICHDKNQTNPTPLILKYQQGGFNTLHQDLYGEVYFPIQAAVFLNQPDIDFSGGEFVLTQQAPRAQAKVTVITPQQGDMVIFATNFLPVKTAKGFKRSKVRHGVSEIRSGQRHTLGIIFHDALS